MFFCYIGNCFAISYITKRSARKRKLPLASLRRKGAEARKGSHSYESAPRERVRKRTLCSFIGKFVIKQDRKNPIPEMKGYGK